MSRKAGEMLLGNSLAHGFDLLPPPSVSAFPFPVANA